MTDAGRPEAGPKFDLHDPHDFGGRDNSLEIAIGQQVRAFRRRQNLTVAELAKQAAMSAGMLSKIENGNTSPSLGTLKALSEALNVPVTAFFRKFEEQRSATLVRAGEGVRMERRGTRAGHLYEMLGQSLGTAIAMEPYLITMTGESATFPVFQHEGQEFLYMLEGEVGYRHGGETYVLRPGDSLLFDADAPHGPEELRRLPIRFLSIIVYPRRESD